MDLILTYHTAFEKLDGLTAEEVEQKAIAKRKMLGNIKFVGKLYYVPISKLSTIRPDQINLLLLGFSDQKIGSSDRKKKKKK